MDEKWEIVSLDRDFYIIKLRGGLSCYIVLFYVFFLSNLTYATMTVYY